MRTIVLIVSLALALSACASGDAGSVPEEQAPAVDAASFDDQVRDLCAETGKAEEKVFSGQDVKRDLKRVSDAHEDLEEQLQTIQPPADRAEAFRSYVEELSKFVEAMRRGYVEKEDHAALEAIVEQSESGVVLRQLADEAELPEECPPLAGTNVHNTLFVAEANLGCFELGQDMLVAGRIKRPKTAKEVGLVLELGRRISAGVAGVIRGADSSGVDKIPVDELVQTNKQRFKAVEDIAGAFRTGDFDAYKRASQRLKSVSARADRLALSVGLIHCAKLFKLLPI